MFDDGQGRAPVLRDRRVYIYDRDALWQGAQTIFYIPPERRLATTVEIMTRNPDEEDTSGCSQHSCPEACCN